MNIFTSVTASQAWRGDALAIAVFTNPKATNNDQTTNQKPKCLELSESLKSLDVKVLGCTLSDLVIESEFIGAVGASVSGRVGIDYAIRKVILIGLGDPAKATPDDWRKASATATRWANKEKVKKLAIAFPDYNQNVDVSVQAIAEGVLLAAHQDKRFKSKDKQPLVLEQVEILETNPELADMAIAKAKNIVDGVILARELVSAPANIVTPITLAETAVAIAAESSYFTAKFSKKQNVKLSAWAHFCLCH